MRTIKIFFVSLSTFLTLGCNKNEVSPKLSDQAKNDLNEIVLLLNNDLEQNYIFPVFIYAPSTTDSTKYIVKTSNSQIYFDKYMLTVKPSGLKFDVVNYKTARVEYKSRYSGDPRKINRMDIYFDK